MIKKCSKCKVEKPLSQFYKMSACKDGHRPNCKECSRATQNVWYKSGGKEWVQKHRQNPDVRERHRLSSAKINATPKRIAYMKKWREQNKERNV